MEKLESKPKTEASLLNRDSGYEVIEENAEGSAFVPPTPQEMRSRIDAARIVTKEMKAQARKDARIAKMAAKANAAEEAAEEVVADEKVEDEEEIVNPTIAKLPSSLIDLPL